MSNDDKDKLMDMIRENALKLADLMSEKNRNGGAQWAMFVAKRTQFIVDWWEGKFENKLPERWDQ